MKKENKEVFERHITQLKTAYYEDWSRNVTLGELEALKNAYEEESGVVYQGNPSLSCGHCQLSLLQTIGRWYFNRKPEWRYRVSPSILGGDTFKE